MPREFKASTVWKKMLNLCLLARVDGAGQWRCTDYGNEMFFTVKHWKMYSQTCKILLILFEYTAFFIFKS